MDPRYNLQPTPSTWDRYFTSVSNEERLAAKALLESDPRRVVLRDAERWVGNPRTDGHRDASGQWVWELELDWEAWVADVDARGRGWSSTEHRLFLVAAAIVTGRPVPLVGVLDLMGSWEADVWRILTEWSMAETLAAKLDATQAGHAPDSVVDTVPWVLRWSVVAGPRAELGMSARTVAPDVAAPRPHADVMLSDMATETMRVIRRRRTNRAIVSGALAAMLVALVLAYGRVGWWRMESACSAEPTGASPVSSVSYSWSWVPLGFTCTYGNGRTETSLWF